MENTGHTSSNGNHLCYIKVVILHATHLSTNRSHILVPSETSSNYEPYLAAAPNLKLTPALASFRLKMGKT